MNIRSPNPTRWTWFSPWMIIGSVCLLAGILFFLAIKNIHREQEFTGRVLLTQANVLMRSIEAGARTGMGMGWGLGQYQKLLEETAKQSDVLFLALTGSKGKVLADSDPSKIGGTIPISFPKPGGTALGFYRKKGRLFEVARPFHPWRGSMMNSMRRSMMGRMMGSMMGSMGLYGKGSRKPPGKAFIIVGLDSKPFDEAGRQDMRQTIILFGTMLLVGAAGFTSLVWAQNYRLARANLQDMRAFTSTVLNQMPVGLVMTDLDGRIQKTNDAALSILRRPEGAQGRHIHDFTGFPPVAGRLKLGETVVEQEIQCRLDDIAMVPLLVNATTIRDGRQRPTGCVFLFSDMSGIKQLEERLRRSERLAGLGMLAAGVAHEIRNPLSSIKGFAVILAGRFREDDRSREIADTLAREVERLDRVVAELLNFARPAELNCRTIACKEVVQNSLKLVEKDALNQGVKIESVVDPEDLQLEVDPDRFAQILLNLCLNAVHAMKQGGTLSVRAFTDNGNAVIVVADSGTGIPPEHLPHIFDPYFTTKPQGVGLGLANVYKFVEAHGGQIEVQSAVGKGTRFTVRLCSSDTKGCSG